MDGVDRTVWISVILLVVLGVVGVWFAARPTALTSTPDDVAAFRAVGAAIFGAALTTFLVVTLHWDYHHRH